MIVWWSGWSRLGFTDLRGPRVCRRSTPVLFIMFPSWYHHETSRSYYHGQKWCPCKRSRSKVKVTEFNTQLSHFQTLTPVSIHIWQWNQAHSWKQHRRGALLFLAATKQLYKWYFPSVRPSEVITNDQSKVHAKGQGQRSRSQRSQPNLTVSGL